MSTPVTPSHVHTSLWPPLHVSTCGLCVCLQDAEVLTSVHRARAEEACRKAEAEGAAARTRLHQTEGQLRNKCVGSGLEEAGRGELSGGSVVVWGTQGCLRGGRGRAHRATRGVVVWWCGAYRAVRGGGSGGVGHIGPFKEW